MTHAGVEGQLEDKAGAVSYRHWSVLRPHVDYLALGHFHKPFQLERWIFNPGSPESVSGAEAAWTPRGYLLVDVDTEQAAEGEQQKHQIVQGDNPRRVFRHYPFKVDQVRTPEELHTLLTEFVQRRAGELRGETAQPAFRDLLPPVVDLALLGTLPFDRNGLDLAAVERLVQEEFRPLVALVRNLTQPTEFAVDVEQTATRAELERQVLRRPVRPRWAVRRRQRNVDDAGHRTEAVGAAGCPGGSRGARAGAPFRRLAGEPNVPTPETRTPCTSWPSSWRTSRATPAPTSALHRA